MARKKNINNINIEDLKRLGPKKIILLLIAAVALYFSGGDFSFNNSNSGTGVNPSGIISGVVARVVDGDTALIRVNGEEIRVRFLGVDTPETVHPKKGVQPYGKEASNFTKQSLTGRQIWLEYDKSPLDRYNRHLAYIWLSKPNKINDDAVRREMFNAKLLSEGYAKVMIIKPNTKYANLFNEIQNEARKSKLGIWESY